MNFAEKAKNFSLRIKKIKVDAVAEGYPLTYLNHLIVHAEYYVAIYSKVLAKIIDRTGRNPGELTIVDFGCGNGLLGCYALHCGFRNVIFQDIDNEFLVSANRLAEYLGIEGAKFVPGDINNLLGQPLRIDAVIGTDVIEHIYDLDIFFSAIQSLNSGMVTVFTTSANPFNPFLVRKLKRLQQLDELSGSSGQGLYGKPHLSFLETRKRMIAEKFPEATNIDELAAATRGLRGADIFSTVEKYQLTNRLPIPANGSNTCDPITGSWTERLMSAAEYKRLYYRYGFEIQIESGFYNNYKKGVSGILSKLLNTGVRLVGKTFSPFIIITGFKK